MSEPLTAQQPQAGDTIRDKIANHLYLIDNDLETEREAVAWIATYARADAAAQTAAAVEALRDMTAAYHQERQHEGRWVTCQKPRCQNVRLLIRDLPEATKQHDKAVAERAVQPWRDAVVGYLNALDGTRSTGDPETQALYGSGVDLYERNFRALTTQEAESAGEGL